MEASGGSGTGPRTVWLQKHLPLNPLHVIQQFPLKSENYPELEGGAENPQLGFKDVD